MSVLNRSSRGTQHKLGLERDQRGRCRRKKPRTGNWNVVGVSRLVWKSADRERKELGGIQKSIRFEHETRSCATRVN